MHAPRELYVPFCCFSQRNLVKYDMVLFCKGEGNDRLSNKYFGFRSCWSQLYHHMKPGKVRRAEGGRHGT